MRQFSNLHGFPKAAELIEITGAHALEASDRAIFNQLLQIAHDSDRLTEPDAEWEITLASLRRAASRHESNDRVRESLRRLRRTEVKVTYISARTGRQRIMETHLLEFTDTDDEEASDATVQFGIPKRLRIVLAKSNRWGRIRCEIAYAMTSKYAIALYELVCLRANREHCVEVLSCEQFRDLIGVPPGTYERGLDFRRKVVDPALLEVNGLSDMGVDIDLADDMPVPRFMRLRFLGGTNPEKSFVRRCRNATGARWAEKRVSAVMSKRWKPCSHLLRKPLTDQRKALAA